VNSSPVATPSGCVGPRTKCRFHRSGTKRIHHPGVGDLKFIYEGVDLPDHPEWGMFAYTTTPGSPTEDRI
jgi:hypothetical protein